MSVSAIMTRLLLLACVSKVCFGQDFLVVNPTAIPGVIESECPLMSELGTSASLHIDPWAVFRTVNILQQSTDVSAVSAVTGMGMSSSAQDDTWTQFVDTPATPDRVTIAPQLPSSERDRFPNLNHSVPLGQARTKLSWTLSEMGLYHPVSNKLISKIVSPIVAWDTDQEIYDCKDRLMGSIRLPFSFDNLLKPFSYPEHQVYDASGNHIANLNEEVASESYEASTQHLLYLTDLNGNALASMRHPTGGWASKPFGEFFDCTIQMIGMNAQVPPPATNPEFLTLVFANAMASGFLLGPYVSMIVYPSILVLFCACTVCSFLLSCLCSLCGSSKKAVAEKTEEKESLIEKKEDSARNGWACCSRRVVAPVNH
jgi:hypothetical protein